MLAGESILLPRATLNVSNVYADALRRAGLRPNFSYRANYPELTKALVGRGFGVAPMPSMLCSPESLEGLVAIPFEKPLYRDLNLIYPRDRPSAGGGAGAHGPHHGPACPAAAGRPTEVARRDDRPYVAVNTSAPTMQCSAEVPLRRCALVLSWNTLPEP